MNSYIHKLAVSIERALDLSGTKGQHIYQILLTRGKPFYGYYAEERAFLKVVLFVDFLYFLFTPSRYNPQMVGRIANLLRSGAILGTPFYPCEVFFVSKCNYIKKAHIPFLLQLFIDYNLFGMGFINLSKVSFRNPVPRVNRVVEWNKKIEYDCSQKGYISFTLD